MPAVNVNIEPEIIKWALSQTQKEKLGDKLMSHITQWHNATSLLFCFFVIIIAEISYHYTPSQKICSI